MSHNLTGFEVEGGVSAFDGKPFVNIRLEYTSSKGKRPRYESAQLRPDKAREIGTMLLECAVESERDAALVAGVQKDLGMGQTEAGMLLKVIRENRIHAGEAS